MNIVVNAINIGLLRSRPELSVTINFNLHSPHLFVCYSLNRRVDEKKNNAFVTLVSHDVDDRAGSGIGFGIPGLAEEPLSIVNRSGVISLSQCQAQFLQPF